jgi:hypothetical protein
MLKDLFGCLNLNPNTGEEEKEMEEGWLVVLRDPVQRRSL